MRGVADRDDGRARRDDLAGLDVHVEYLAGDERPQLVTARAIGLERHDRLRRRRLRARARDLLAACTDAQLAQALLDRLALGGRALAPRIALVGHGLRERALRHQQLVIGVTLDREL